MKLYFLISWENKESYSVIGVEPPTTDVSSILPVKGVDELSIETKKLAEIGEMLLEMWVELDLDKQPNEVQKLSDISDSELLAKIANYNDQLVKYNCSPIIDFMKPILAPEITKALNLVEYADEWEPDIDTCLLSIPGVQSVMELKCDTTKLLKNHCIYPIRDSYRLYEFTVELDQVPTFIGKLTQTVQENMPGVFHNRRPLL